MISAGRLRHRVAIEELIVTMDTDGAKVESWSPLLPRLLSAEIRALSGRELIASAAVQSRVTTRIRIRYQPGIKAGMRARHRDEIYSIEAVVPDPDSRVRYMTLQCSSGVQHVNETVA